MNVGIPLWIGNIIKYSVEDLIREITKSNIDYVEFSIDYPLPYNEGLFKKSISLLNKLRNNNLEIALHAPWRDLAIASPYDRIRRASIETIIEAVKSVVSEISISYVVIHPTTYQRTEISNSKSVSIRALRESIEYIHSYFSDTDILILIENLSRGFSSSIDTLVEILSNIKNRRIGLCFDVGHLKAYYDRHIRERGYYESFIDYYRDMLTIIKNSIPDRVYTVHVHGAVDNMEHLPPNESDIEFKQVYKLLGEINPQYVLFEVFKSRSKTLSINDVVEIARAGKTWLMIYASSQ
ncbi:MAG: sugar phosphate isomerase/epimerase family protein [Thermoprotei archaeon]